MRRRRSELFRKPGAPLASLAAAIGLTAVLVALLILRGVPAVVTWLDVGSPGDESYISGAFQPELNAAESYRWTTGSAMVTLPVPGRGRYRVELALATTGGTTRAVSIACGERETTVPLAGLAGDFTTIIDCAGDGDLRLSMEVPTIRVPGDGRAIGVSLRDVRVSALDARDVAAWRIRVAFNAAALVAGVWLAATALRPGRSALIAAGSAGLAVLWLIVRHDESLLASTLGLGGVLALVAGLAAYALAGGRRRAATGLAIGALILTTLLDPPDASRVLPALWTPGDIDGLRLLPWLVCGCIATAAALGGRRSPYVAALGTAIGAGMFFAPFAASQVAARWTLTLAVPDWTDQGSAAGALYVAGVFALGITGAFALRGARLPGWAGVGIVAAVTLGLLLPWRMATMKMNGDEPHYFVTAHSLGVDRDLELLDDYLEPAYRAATISPDGNIAVERDTSTDRYLAHSPGAEAERWLLVPPAPSGLSASTPQTGLLPDDGAVVEVRDGTGDREDLPPLAASADLAIVTGGPCAISDVWIGAPDNGPRQVAVRLRDAGGVERWSTELVMRDGPAHVSPPLGADTCVAGSSWSIAIASSGGTVVAMGVDRHSGLRIAPGKPARDAWALGPLPRDRYATQTAYAQVAVTNPSDTAVKVALQLLGEQDTTVRATTFMLGPRSSHALPVNVPAGAFVMVSASAPVVAGGNGWLPGGSYTLPEPAPAAAWSIEIPAGADRDAGVWIGIANPASQAASVTVVDGTRREEVRLCGACATMVHVAAGGERREVRVDAAGSPRPYVAAVTYEERTAELHFDLGLPLLAALPVAAVGPGGGFAVSVAAAVALAIGLYLLLRRSGIAEHPAAAGSVGVVALAPFSPYAVRLYTEPLAACVIVWVVLGWDLAREHPRAWYPALAGAITLPLIHGRFAAITIVLVAALVARAPSAMRSVRSLALAALIGSMLFAVLASGLAVGLRERVALNYVRFDWAPNALPGLLLDRGTGLLPFAPWIVLAAFAGRLAPAQRLALVLLATQLTAVAVRAGGWQTWGPPGRYLLPVVPLVALLAVPGALRLLRDPFGSAIVSAAVVWSITTSMLLHWLPLSGYATASAYLIDSARAGLPPLAPLALFPAIRPGPTSNLLGLGLVIVLWGSALAFAGLRWRRANRSAPAPTTR